MLTQKSQKSQKIFICKDCNYKTCKKTDFIKHISTAKHQNIDKMLTIVDTNSQIITKEKYRCECGKKYKHRQSLFVHRKICNFNHNNEQCNNDKLVQYLVKENTELKNMIIDVCKNINTTSQNNNSFNNTTYSNSNNKTFNLQFFLNETCKDAMNIMDFVDSIKLQLTDLENVGKLGYVEGISNIITTNLKALDITQRPIHCADKKREVIYIKDQDKWEKEDEEKRKIKKAIHRVACKNQKLIEKFKEEHPDCLKASSKFSDQYNKIIVESMGGSGDNDKEKEEKIIKNISKNIIIEKE